MEIFQNISDWQHMRKTLPASNMLGFIPTMGNLHAGHASLVSRSKQENDYTLASLFVNPTQFNQRDDFIHYPRTLDNDLALLEEHGVDFCLLPDENSMYSDNYRYQIVEKQNDQLMEGRSRPGHFTGVLTIVMKLLHLARANRAYFGEKDYQQLELIRGMVANFFMDVEIIGCPTIRETSGLAFSSRNNRLSPDERKLADQFAILFQQNQSIADLSAALNQLGIIIEYIEEHQNRRFAAVKIGQVRLIDNYALK
ncbi:MAG: pantoate--beta-alanine ligase [Legionella sp.]